jgi:hypothetical protein
MIYVERVEFSKETSELGKWYISIGCRKIMFICEM